jgi:hypothetical protein
LLTFGTHSSQAVAQIPEVEVYLEDAGVAPKAAAYCSEEGVTGWPKRSKLAQAFLWEYSDKRLKLAQLLGQLGVFLT